MQAAIYVRVSTGAQETDGTSLDTQEAACRAYAAQQGYEVAEVYREVHTGTELWERPKLSALRMALREQKVTVAIVYAIDRLSRDPVHLGVLLSEAEHVGATMEFVSEPLDNTSEGQLIRYVRGYAAKVEHEKIKERAMRGKLARVRSGRLMPGGRVRYGYRWRDETRGSLDVDETTASIVRRIFAAAASGVPLRSIAAGLTADGIPTPTRGRPNWRHTTVVQILNDRLYTGEAAAFRYQVVRLPGGVKQERKRPEAERIPLPSGTVPPIVDEATFEAVQMRLVLNKERAVRNNHNPESALLRGGLVRCAVCGNAMTVVRPGGKAHESYVCNNREAHQTSGETRPAIQVRILDGAAWDRITALLTQPRVVARELARLESDDPSVADLRVVERELAEVGRKRRNLVAQLEDLDPASARTVRERLSALNAQSERLDAERGVILGRRETWQAARNRLSDLEAWCGTVAGNLPTLTYAEKRDVLDSLGMQARVWGASHEPRYEIVASIPLDTDIVSTTSRNRGCRPTS